MGFCCYDVELFWSVERDEEDVGRGEGDGAAGDGGWVGGRHATELS